MKISKLEEQSNLTRRNILNAAEDLFFSQGYAQTTVDDICKAAGITKGAFYHHFQNKDAVYQHRFLHRLDQYLEAHYQLSEKPTAKERYLRLAQCTFESGKECGKELVGRSITGQLNDKRSRLYQADRLHTQLLTAAYEAARAEGCFPETIDLPTSIMLYACMVSGFLFKWAASPDDADSGIDWDLLLETEIDMMTGFSR